MTSFFQKEDKKTITKAICDKIAQGLSVESAIDSLRKEGSPTCCKATFFSWLASDKETLNYYMRARENRADVRFESLDAIVEDIKNGKLESDRARIVIDVIKWQMGKEKGSVYGMKSDITTNGQPIQTRDATSILLSKIPTAILETALKEAQDATE